MARFAQAFQIAELVFQLRICRPFLDVMDDGRRCFLSITTAFHADKFVAAKRFPAHCAPMLAVIEVVFHIHLKANKNAPSLSAGAYVYNFSIVMISQVQYDIPRHTLYFNPVSYHLNTLISVLKSLHRLLCFFVPRQVFASKYTYHRATSLSLLIVAALIPDLITVQPERLQYCPGYSFYPNLSPKGSKIGTYL